MCGYFEQSAQSRHGPRGDDIERSLNAFDFATDYLCFERKRLDDPVEKVGAESARLYRRLTRIALDAPVPPEADALRRLRGETEGMDALCERLRFGPLTRTRLKALLT